MPSSGSDGNGYNLAKGLGHKIIDIFPALVQLMLEGPILSGSTGVKFVGTAELIYNNKSIDKDREISSSQTMGYPVHPYFR